MRMDGFSGTLGDLEARFGSEQACWDYLLKLRWPEGFGCPRCGGRTAWTTTRHLLVCAGCQYQASVTAGTIFQDTRTPLTLWFRAIWWVTAQKHGASALELLSFAHLDYYLDEFTFRYNRRGTPMAAFQSLLGLGTTQAPTTYRQITAHDPGSDPVT